MADFALYEETVTERGIRGKPYTDENNRAVIGDYGYVSGELERLKARTKNKLLIVPLHKRPDGYSGVFDK